MSNYIVQTHKIGKHLIFNRHRAIYAESIFHLLGPRTESILLMSEELKLFENNFKVEILGTFQGKGPGLEPQKSMC